MAKDVRIKVGITNNVISVKVGIGQTVIKTVGPEKYTPAPITPTEEQQTIPTKDKQLTANVVVEPIPSEYIIPTGTEEITVTENGTVSRNVTAKATVTVNTNVPIPPGYIIPSGNLKITENGQYDITEKASVTVDVPVPTGTKQISITENGTTVEDVAGYANAEISVDVPSDVETVTGEVTISNYGNFPTITHGLGTKKIALIIYPITEVKSNAGYQRFYLSYINVPEIIGNVNWPLDFTAYNSRFTGVVNADSTYLKTVGTQLSPWTSQGSWYLANQEESVRNTNVTTTDDTVTVNTKYKWANATYRYIVYKLG